MGEPPKPSCIPDRSVPVEPTLDGEPLSRQTASAPAVSDSGIEGRSDAIPVFEETLTVSKRRIPTGRVRVTTRTETHEETAAIELDRNVVDVTRVPIGRVVDQLPEVRTEGTTTIVPVVEERLVVVKQLFLKEELHIRQDVKRDTVRQPVTLRRQHVLVERFDPEGRVIGPEAPQS